MCCQDDDNDENRSYDNTLYINNKTLEAIGIVKNKCFRHKVSYFMPNYNPCLVYRIIYDKKV